jgi:oligopeptide transport system substrate-binding protein
VAVPTAAARTSWWVRPDRRALRLLVVLVGICLLAAACADSGPDGGGNDVPRPTEPPAPGPVQGGTLVDLQNFAATGDPHHIDPALADTVQESQPGRLLFDGLTETDYRTGQVRPMVAESYASNPDATVWTFRLRRDVRFNNGDPVLPSDFKFAWERAVQRELASRVAYHFDPIKGKKEVDAGTSRELTGVTADDQTSTLTVELAYPYSTFPAAVSHLVFSPVPRAVRALPDQSKWEQGVMVGNGPFRMKEAWQHDQSITLARNEGYWGGLSLHKAYLDQLVFRISKDADSAFADFEAGHGQTALIPAGRYAEVERRYRGRISTRPTLGTSFWVFNMKDPVVGGPENKELREAIALAVDRRFIVNTIYGGLRRVATAMTPPAMPGYQPGLDKEAGRNLARARQLMREYGRTPPPIKLNFAAGSENESVAVILQANLKDIGVPTQLDPRDPSTYFTSIGEGTGQFSRSAWIADYVAYDSFTYPLFHSASIGGDNQAQYSNPRVDALIDEGRRTRDETERDARYREAERLVLDDQVVVPLNWFAGAIVYDRSVRNFLQSPLQFVAYEEISLRK